MTTRLRPLLGTALRSIGRLGFGRQGALAAARRAFPARAHTPARRAISLVCGSLFIGVGVSLLTRAELGLSPFDVFVSGVRPLVGLSFGQTVWLVSAALFALAALLRQVPSPWGIAFVLLNGVSIDTVSGFINAPSSLVARIAFVAMALVVLPSGIALVVHSGSTGGAFELLMRAGEERGLDRVKVRTFLEVSVLTSGILLGGSFGFATVAIAVLIGPLIGIAGQALEDHTRGRVIRQVEASPERRHPSAAGAR